MLVCTSATTLPTVIVSAAITHSTRDQSRADRAEVEQENAQETGEGGELHPDRHERGDRRRRAFVGVGRPHMKRDRGDLEAEADQQHADAEQQRSGCEATPWSRAARIGSSLMVPVAP